MQTEKSGTLGTGNNQAIFCMATQQGGAELRTDDRAPTLTAAAGMSGNNQPVVCAGFKLGNSEQARSIGYQEELSPTLNAECGGNKPAVVAPEVALDMTHACDVIRECGEQVPALQARMGTGGNQVPLTYQVVTGTLSPGAHAGSYNGQDAYNDMLVCGATPDVAHALRAKANCAYREDAETYICSAVDCRNGQESDVGGALQAQEHGHQPAVMAFDTTQITSKQNGSIPDFGKPCHTLNANAHVPCAVLDVSHALRAKAGCAYREDAETYPVQNMVARRLTPLECERLQGFPDGWTDIGDYTDSTGKKRKTSDSARYKALGNSIALPFWRWMFGRMAAYLPEGATLGSLFDGIGGFPLCWENIHGAGTAIWASEIEEFPIAVTKLRFGGAIT